MSWERAKQDWPSTLARLKQRFPRIDQVAHQSPPPCVDAFAGELAAMHDLTRDEAAQTLQDIVEYSQPR